MSKPHALLLSLSLASSAAWLPCQDAPAPTVATQAPPVLMHLHLGGPGAWRRDLGPTNLGALLSSERGQQLAAPLLQSLEDSLLPVFGTAERYAGVRRRLLDFGGSLEMTLALRPDEDLPTIVLRLCGDGSTDVPALAEELFAAAARAAGQEPADRSIGGGKATRVVALPDGMLLTAPAAHGGDAIAVIAPGEATGAALDRALAAPPAPLTGPFAARFSMPQITARLAADMGDDRHYLRILGLDSLEEVRFEVGAAGPHVRLDLEQSFAGEPRGLFAALFPPDGGVSGLARLLPRGGSGYKIGRFDVRALVRTLHGVIAEFSPDTAKEMVEMLGAEFDQGILAQMTDEYVMFGQETGEEDEDGERESATFGVAFRVRDAAAFLPEWTRLRKEVGFTALEQDERDGFTYERIGGLLPANTQTAIGNGLFVFAFGPHARTKIDELVATLGKDAGRPATELTAEELAAGDFRDARRHAPKGLNGYSRADVRFLLLQGIVGLGAIGEMFDAFGPTQDLPREQRDAFFAMLEQHNLLVGRSMTGHQDGRWLFRVLW